jgi:basic amino acid/polyamine antiporter, APA family
MFGGTWAGYVMAVVVIISRFGALNGWTMICAEMPLAAAKDGLSPERFKHISKNGVPAYGIIASAGLASIAMAINYIGSGGSRNTGQSAFVYWAPCTPPGRSTGFKHLLHGLTPCG